MTNNDDRFRASLNADDEAFLNDLEGGRGLFAQYFDTFHGPLMIWNIAVAVFTLVATGLAIWCSYNFVTSPELRDMILWGGGAWAAWTAQVALKQWVHHRMNMMNILREVKRLQLQVAELQTKR